MDDYYQYQEVFHKKNKLIKSIKCNIKEHCNNINDLKNEIELSFYMLHTKKNYEKILYFKNQLSKTVLNNIKFNKLFIKNDEGVLLVKKMELVKMFNLPDEIIDIILIKLF